MENRIKALEKMGTEAVKKDFKNETSRNTMTFVGGAVGETVGASLGR